MVKNFNPRRAGGQSEKIHKRQNPWYVATMLLSVRSRSVREMEKRLKEKGFSGEQVTKVVDKAKELGYLDDKKFAVAVCEGILLRKAVGRRELLRKLRTYEVDSDIIAKTIEEVFPLEKEKDVAKKALIKKKESLDKKGIARKDQYMKIGRFLAQRGFSGTIANELLSHFF